MSSKWVDVGGANELSETEPFAVFVEGCAIALKRGSWDVPAVFPLLQKLGGIPDAEMFRVFNMGIGLVMVVAEWNAEAITRYLRTEADVPAWVIGEVVEGNQAVEWESPPGS